MTDVARICGLWNLDGLFHLKEAQLAADDPIETPGEAVAPGNAKSASKLINEKIAALSGRRGEILARIRNLIHEAEPNIIKEVKWRKPTNPSGVAIWSYGRTVCTGEIHKDKVKTDLREERIGK